VSENNAKAKVDACHSLLELSRKVLVKDFWKFPKGLIGKT
jgi:hypothetical protein